MIVFLDDDPDLGILFQKKFSCFGDVIKVYTNTKKLLESGDLEKASVFCFDINLHLENGIEFIKQISPKYPNLSTVCFSNYSDLLEDQLFEAGVNSYVCKDDGIEALEEVFERIFEERSIFKTQAS
jgi:DNA-binding NtrC family response regulator